MTYIPVGDVPDYSMTWYEMMIEKPDVSQFVHAYLREHVSAYVSKPSLLYPAFLSVVYQKGGLDLVKEMLKSHNPEYHTPPARLTVSRRLQAHPQPSGKTKHTTKFCRYFSLIDGTMAS